MHRALLMTALLVSACTPSTEPAGEAPAPLTELPRALSASEERVRSASNTFTVSLFHRLNEAQRDANVSSCRHSAPRWRSA